MSVTTLIWIVAIFLLAAVFALAAAKMIWKKMHFTPNPDKGRQQERLNRLLKEAGFYYDRRSDVFSSLHDCWQREMGYCRLYDEGAGSFNMVMDCEPIRFSYAGKNWLIELWKGQYGITTGGEIGIYTASLQNKEQDPDRILYTSVPDDHLLPMHFTLRKNGRILFKRKDVHWWLTGFRLGEFSSPKMLAMDAAIRFPNRAMRDAFLQGLKDTGYTKGEFSLRGNTVIVRFTEPHSPQPLSRGSLQEGAVQKVNQANCELYAKVTGDYADTLDKLEYLEHMAPELFEFCMHSLYAKGFYEIYKTLKHLPDREPEKPVPPVRPCPPDPCPPRPCPPETCPPRPCPPRPCPPGPYPPKPCPPKPCPPGPYPPKPCPPRPCPPEACTPRPCQPKPCTPGPCPPETCTPRPYPPETCTPRPYPPETCTSRPCPPEAGPRRPYPPEAGPHRPYPPEACTPRPCPPKSCRTEPGCCTPPAVSCGCRSSCPPQPGNRCRSGVSTHENDCCRENSAHMPD